MDKADDDDWPDISTPYDDARWKFKSSNFFRFNSSSLSYVACSFVDSKVTLFTYKQHTKTEHEIFDEFFKCLLLKVLISEYISGFHICRCTDRASPQDHCQIST